MGQYIWHSNFSSPLCSLPDGSSPPPGQAPRPPRGSVDSSASSPPVMKMCPPKQPLAMGSPKMSQSRRVAAAAANAAAAHAQRLPTDEEYGAEAEPQYVDYDGGMSETGDTQGARP